MGNHNTVRDPPSFQSLQSAALQLPSTDPDSFASNSVPRILRPTLLVFSTNDKGGLKRLTAEYLQYFEKTTIPHDQVMSYLNNLAYTLSSRRSSLPWKSFLLADSIDDLRHLDTKISPPQQSMAKPTLGLIFTGQGAQWAGMGRELSAFAIFERSLREAEDYLSELGCRWRLRGMCCTDPNTQSLTKSRGALQRRVTFKHQQTRIQPAINNGYPSCPRRPPS